ncbi:MAG TPA: glycosyltransferase, partial [Gemmatimonadales bacterium]|nr:glycosyltransferase [Gemmatimonadales bacterium]
GELEASLTQAAANLGISSQVHLLGLRSDVANLLAAADVFVLPSLSEGLPLALLEAMLAGRPIVASDVGEIRSVLANGYAGRLVPPGDAAALAGAVGELLDSPAEAKALGERAAGRAAAEYTVERMTERYAEIYGSLLGIQTDSVTAGTARTAGPAPRGRSWSNASGSVG